MSIPLTLEICSGKNDDNICSRSSSPIQSAGVLYTSFDDFGTQMVRKLAPQSVLSPLFSDRFDCIDVGRCLATAEFSGMFCVLADTLPNTAMVQRELERQFPSLDLRVISHEDARADVSPEPCRALA